MIRIIIIIVLALLGLALRSVAKKSEENGKLLGIASWVLFAFSGLTVFASTIRVVDAGHVGVPVTFGSVSNDYLTEGLHIVNPFSNIEQMSVRTEEYTMSATHTEGKKQGDDSVVVLSKDSLEIPLDITVLYRLVPSDSCWVYRNFGMDYDEKIIRSTVRTSVREAASEFVAQEIFSSKREAFSSELQKILESKIKSIMPEDKKNGGVVIQQVMLRKIGLPERVKTAIEMKLKSEQEAQAMEFVLQKEKQEAQRKQIEAEGIQKFQEIVSRGITDALLKWKGIDATLRLAESPNAKVLIIGGKDGMPLILNSESK